MKRSKMFYLIIILIGFSPISNLSAQTVKKDFDSTTMSIVSIVINKSNNIVLPPKLINELKQYALQNNYPQNQVLKSSIALQMLYCNNLTYNEKKVYLDWAVSYYTFYNKYIPVSYFTKALEGLKQ